MTPELLEQQLKRLCEVDSEHFRAHTRDSDVSWATTFRPGLALWLTDDGKLQGWEALGFMLTAMQERYRTLSDSGIPAKHQPEYNVLFALSNKGAMDLTPELILSTYVQWREVLAK